MNIQITENHGELENFYINNGLELEKNTIGKMNPILSIVCKENGIIACGATVSMRFGINVLDYIAVEKSFRRKNLGTKLFNKIAENFDEFFLTAKVPEFFYSVGCKKTTEKAVLLGECDGCPQYKNGCNPIVLKYSKGEKNGHN